MIFKKLIQPLDPVPHDPVAPAALLTFRVGSREFSVDVQHVVEIRDLETDRGRSGSQSRSAMEVVSASGKPFRLIDLRQIYSDGPSDRGHKAIVVLQSDGVDFGIVVDAVCAIVDPARLGRSSAICMLDIQSILAFLPGGQSS